MRRGKWKGIEYRISSHIYVGCRGDIAKKIQVAILRAFIDESAVSVKDGPAFIFGGFIGSVLEFERASDAWQEGLDALPALPYYHRRESQDAQRALSFSKTISRFELQPVVVTMPHRPFLSRNKSAARGRFGSKVYDWAFITAVREILAWVDENRPEGEQIDFVFDNRQEFARCRDEFFNRFSAEPKGIWLRAGTCTPGDDKKIAALQMGDLLAGEILECMRSPDPSQSPVLMEIAKRNPILLFKGNAPRIIRDGLILENLGKQIFDIGRKKIQNYPSNSVPVRLFAGEYAVLKVLESLVVASKEEESAYEAPTARCRIQAFHDGLTVSIESIEDGAEPTH
jgi:hypothetical protein